MRAETMSHKQGKIGKHGISNGAKDRPQDTSSASVPEPIHVPDEPSAQPVQSTIVMSPIGKAHRAPTVSPSPVYAASASDRPAGYGGVNQAHPLKSGFENGSWNPEAAQQAPKSKRPLIIAIACLVAALLAVYFGGVVFFMGHFYPGTMLGGADISLKSSAEASSIAQSTGDKYSITVSGDGASFTVSAKDAGMQVDGSSVVAQALAANSAWKWPFEIASKHDITSFLVAGYNSNGLEKVVKTNVEAFNQTAADPVNATIAYASSSKSFAVQAEKAGTKIDVDKVLSLVDDAIVDMKNSVTLGPDQLIQPTVLKTDPALATACNTANTYIKANLDLVLGTTSIHAATINGDQISQWVTLGSDMGVTFDENAMNSWLQKLADSLNTVGTSRTYKRSDGATFTVSGGTYGWQIDNDSLIQQVKDGIKQGSSETITVPTISEGATWTGAGAPDWGAYVDVDLTTQHARFYDASGVLKWESDVVTGTPDGAHETPTGVWQLFKKESPSVLKGDISVATGQPEYQTQVQYWMAFTYSGCGLHDATWQSSFGGTRYKDGYGSHGCVNLPLSAAADLYNLVNVGNAVVVHY